MPRLMTRAALIGALLLTPLAGVRAAEPTPSLPQTGEEWRQVLIRDLDGARDILRTNHPAGHPALKQAEFLDWLDRGHALGLGEADKATNYATYMAILNRYAAGFGDGHIRAAHVEDRREFRWPGFVVGLRGSRWVIMDRLEEAGIPGLGAEVVACDGQAIADLAQARLNLSIDWRVEAQRVSRAPGVFIDTANALAPPIKTCTFMEGGERRSHDLTWRGIDPKAMTGHYIKGVAVSRPGFGIRPFANGHWIALQSLSDEAAPVVEQIEREAETFRKAPFIVLDLRGNGGGNSRFTSRIAEALYGRPYVRSRQSGTTGNCSTRWRVSDGNLATVEAYRTRLAAAMGAEADRVFGQLATDMRGAMASGQPFTPATGSACRIAPASPSPSPSPREKPAFSGKLLLLTDHACFSSCLIAAEEFRKLGAVHIGTPTNKGVPFTEVREVLLPSGLAKFSTMQAYAPALPDSLGPYVPSFRYDGDITDTAALERWVADVVLPGLGK